VLLAAHVTGMEQLLAAPSAVNDGSPALLLFSAGKSGSVKRWKLKLAHVMKKLGVEGESAAFGKSWLKSKHLCCSWHTS
jgi:hypothetical protein